MLQHYRKKPVVIRAMKFDGQTNGTPGSAGSIITSVKELAREDDRMAKFLYDEAGDLTMHLNFITGAFAVTTMEGIMRVNEGDFVIVGTQGEIYPCKPGAFEAVYELVDWEHDRVSDLWPTRAVAR